MLNKNDFVLNKEIGFYKVPYTSNPRFILNTLNREGCLYCQFGIVPVSHDGEIPDDFVISDKTISDVLERYCLEKEIKSWLPYPENIPKDNSHWLVVNNKGQMRSMTFKDGEWKHPEFNVVAYRELPEWRK